MLQLSEFVWALRFSIWVVFNNYLTDRSKISSDQKRLFFAVSMFLFTWGGGAPVENKAPVPDQGLKVQKLNFAQEHLKHQYWDPLKTK